MQSLQNKYYISVDEKHRKEKDLGNGKKLYIERNIGSDYELMPYWGSVDVLPVSPKLKKGEEVGFFHQVYRFRTEVLGDVHYVAKEEQIICTLKPKIKAFSIWSYIKPIEKKLESKLDLVAPTEESESNYKVLSVGHEAKTLGLESGDEIILKKNADYSIDIKEEEFMFCRMEKIIYNKTKDECYNTYSIIEPLDEGDNFAKTKSGIWIQSKEKKVKGLGRIINTSKDSGIEKGKTYIYNKRDFMKIDYKGNDYYACPSTEILAEKV